MKIKQKEHLKKIRTVKEVDPLVRHLNQEEGFYGVFVNVLDNYIYIGYAKNVRKACQELLSKSRGKRWTALSGYMAKFAFTFDKMPVSVSQIELERTNKHLKLIYQYKTYPPAFNGHGLNFVNPTTGKRFKKV